MKYHKSIKVLTNHLEKLNQALEEEEKTMDEPEMIADYTFAKANAGNIELEIISITESIDILRRF